VKRARSASQTINKVGAGLQSLPAVYASGIAPRLNDRHGTAGSPLSARRLRGLRRGIAPGVDPREGNLVGAHGGEGHEEGVDDE
jgi:hypothetical protein